MGKGFAANLETLTMSMPDARARVDATRQRMSAIQAARSAAQA
jgi:hypothetical protein